MGALIAVDQSRRVPTEHDDLAKLTAMAQAATVAIDFANRPYLTGQYWILGRCMFAAKIKFGKHQQMYRKWRKQVGIPLDRISRAEGIARKWETREEAERYTVTKAFQLSKKKNPIPDDGSPALPPVDNDVQKLDINHRLLAVKQKLDDIANDVSYENDEDAFVQGYNRLLEIQHVVTEMISKHYGRYGILTTNNESDKVA